MLRNINYLFGFLIAAIDGDIGAVKDFYFDDETWTVRYLTVKTGDQLSTREILISPEAVTDHFWESTSFSVGLTRQQVRDSPDIDTNRVYAVPGYDQADYKKHVVHFKEMADIL